MKCKLTREFKKDVTALVSILLVLAIMTVVSISLIALVGWIQLQVTTGIAVEATAPLEYYIASGSTILFVGLLFATGLFGLYLLLTSILALVKYVNLKVFKNLYHYVIVCDDRRKDNVHMDKQ